ncbi:MAG: LamG-like jellyroll fold domain-containing protein [Chitinophagales bacterium]
MKYFYSLVVILLANIQVFAQSNQYIHFDGEDDYVAVENGAQYIDGLNTFSMTGWFYADALQYGAGMMGIRGEGDGSGAMYMLQLSNGALECRINTTSGLFEVVGAAGTVVAEQWQHYAFVYNGSTFEVFVDGVSLGTDNASGVFQSVNKPFSIGKSLISGFNFVYPGRADEVSLWSKTLTQVEITDMISNELVGNETGLELYFKCDQGFPNGDNTAITHLKNEIGTGERDAELFNLELLADSSNFGGTLDPMNQAISFPQPTNREASEAPFALSAITTSGLPVSYSIVSGPAVVSNNNIQLIGNAGVVEVEASQAGNASFNPASPVTASFNVIKGDETYANIDIRNPLEGDVYAPVLAPLRLAAIVDIDFPDLLTVNSVEFRVADEKVGIKDWGNHHYTGWWTPPAYGSYTFDVTVVNNYGATYTESVDFTVVNSTADINIDAFSDLLLNNSIGVQEATTELPSFVGSFNQLQGTLDIACTPDGCDPWDRVSRVEVQGHDGEWYEIIRYLTPYGVACDHDIDLTDFMSLFQGKVNFRASLATQGEGYLYSLNLDYVAGTPAQRYSKVEKLWQATYDFGNYANLQPVETLNIDYDSNTEASVIKLVSTGHGWDIDFNTGNAAEFHEDTHHLWIDGVETFEQHNWNDCNPNPDGCSPQAGTWQFDRAGWCPGSIAQWFDYDMTPYISTNSVELAYIFNEDYVDLCHPNHPDCVTGVTCANCDQGFNPHLIVASYEISKSNTPFHTDTTYSPVTGIRDIADNPIEFNVYPNPNIGKFIIDVSPNIEDYSVTIYDVIGNRVLKNNHIVEGQIDIDISGVARGVYVVQISAEGHSTTKKIIIEK